MPQASPGERPGLQNLEWYRTMRDNEPVWRDPKTGIWNVFRYEDGTEGKEQHPQHYLPE